MDQITEILIKLLRAEIDEDYALPELSLSSETIKSILETAQKHSLVHLVSDALKRTQRIEDAALLSLLNSNVYSAVIRHQILDDELKQIASVLERHQIPYIPLKGSVLCEDYPKAWMRSRRDIDVLVSAENHQRACDALCEELKYSFFRENKNDRVFTTRNQLTVEVHHQLISDDYIPQAMSFLDSVWKKSAPVSANGYCFRMDSDMYVYHHIAHMAKHCLKGGCGIRPVLDLWIISKNRDYMSDELRKWLKKSGLLVFAESMNELCKVWFCDEPHTKSTLAIQEFIVVGGEMGNENFCHFRRMKKRGGKIGYFLSRIFLSYPELKEQYPIVEKHKILMPFCQIHRLISFLFGKKRNVMKSEVKKVNTVSQTDNKIISNAWKCLGIDKKF